MENMNEEHVETLKNAVEFLSNTWYSESNVVSTEALYSNIIIIANVYKADYFIGELKKSKKELEMMYRQTSKRPKEQAFTTFVKNFNQDIQAYLRIHKLN